MATQITPSTIGAARDVAVSARGTRLGNVGKQAFICILAFAPLALAQTPQIAGVVNAANFQPPVAPGALISIFGSNLATGQAEAHALPLPTNLLGTMVFINGIAAPLLYVSPSQINAQVPYEIPPNTSATISVHVNNTASSNSTLERLAR